MTLVMVSKLFIFENILYTLSSTYLGSWIITSVISQCCFFLYCLHLHFTGGKYLIAGGYVVGDDKMTEVVELVQTNSTPSFGQLPSTPYYAVGTMLGNAPILCGGYDRSSSVCRDGGTTLF